MAVDWGATPRWQSPTPRAVYAGETLHLFALFDRPPAVSPRLRWQADGERRECASTAFGSGVDGAALVRLCGARQLELCDDKTAARALALKYQLLGEHTNLFLVYERAAGEKAIDGPALQQIRQMQAAGQAGMGSVRAHRAAMRPLASMVPPALFSELRMAMSTDMQCSEEPMNSPIVTASRAKPDFSPPPDALARYSASEAMDPPAAIVHLFERFNQWAPRAQNFAEVERLLSGLPPFDETADALNALLAAGFDRVTAWALLLQRLADQYSATLTLERHAKRLLKIALIDLPDERRETAEAELSDWF